jgi:hypothetical protein
MAAAAGAQPRSSADLFCTDLVRVVAAAGERPAFASLRAIDDGAGSAMLGFRDGCGRSEDEAGRSFGCYRQLPPAELRVDALAESIARCLPAAERLADPPGDGRFREHIVRFRVPNATIEIAEGGWRTAGGGSVVLIVRPAR